jgi:transcriptional regulator of acetoin/glycerol metabolism
MTNSTHAKDASSGRIDRYWQSFVAEDRSLTERERAHIRPEILASWERSKEYGVSPFKVSNDLLSPDMLRSVLRENEQLISVAHPYFQTIYPLLSGSNFVIALTDRYGNVIDLIGLSGEIEQRAKSSSLTIGCNRSEEISGTCGIGTCIALKKPIQIWGTEHYIKPHHDYVCSAAPINDSRGELLGVIDVIGPAEDVTEHTLAMVCAAADGVEKELRLHDINREITIANQELLTTLQSISQGILLLRVDGVITQANSSAYDILRLNGIDLPGLNIQNVLDLETASLNILSLTRNVSHREWSITNKLGIRLNLSISASLIQDDAGKKTSTVIVFEERRKFNKMASHVSGFTAHYSFDQIIGSSDSIRDIKKIGELAAHSDSNVLILGESGTGKELLAQSIHNASLRANAPFVSINCGSLPHSLVESELFGYESGAFTGASKDGSPGKFELADGGTLFLDEIGDMPLNIQVMLLRVIQTREILRIGGKMPKRVDVRIIAATNSNLVEAIAQKHFRKDLFYRLNVLSFHMPALRERKEDIPVLLEHLVENYNQKMGLNVKGFTPEALSYLMQYEWPGNIRELENMVERAMNLTPGPYLSERELSPEIIANNLLQTGRAPARTGGRFYGIPALSALGEPEPRAPEQGRTKIAEALRMARGNVTKASVIAGIPKRTFYRKIEKYEIDISEFRM